MTRNAAPAFCLIIVLCAGPLTFAQSPATTAPEAFSPLVKPAATAPASAPARAVSPATAAHLAITAPKYIAPASATAKAAASAPDLRETDRPRNTIIRLPNYVVRQSKEVIYKEDQFITPEGKLRRTYARHRGLHAGSFWLFKNDPAAHQIQGDDERVERRAELSDLLGLLQVGADPAVERSLRTQVQSTFMNSADWLSLDGSFQHSREIRQ